MAEHPGEMISLGPGKPSLPVGEDDPGRAAARRRMPKKVHNILVEQELEAYTADWKMWADDKAARDRTQLLRPGDPIPEPQRPEGASKPLLHIEAHKLLEGRMAQQRKRIARLDALSVLEGNSESYATWEKHHAPQIRRLWQYTGTGEGGFGQGPRGRTITPEVLDSWRLLKANLLRMQLEITGPHRSDRSNPHAVEAGFLTEPEAVSLCNLQPGNAEEAQTLMPSLLRFAPLQTRPGHEVYCLEEVITEILQLQDMTKVG
eukprot:TRINITY_DN47015_c0_g1_i1.p1 TRINITY_DN47015_c0_g1~~TRINITY_DN47015_c0_g1_i1.p1  ORF type:complete len:292 (+),score=86.28 TRINITY_DN47015_c0_g1_i1:95-877(+)